MTENKNIEIGKRIKEARTNKKMTQEHLGKLLGLNKSTIQRYETGKIDKIKLPILENIAVILNVNPSWLALKCDNPEPVKPQKRFDFDLSMFDNIQPVQKIRLPMLGEIACGKPIFADEQHETYVEIDGSYGADFCLKAVGDSMINAGIDNKDVVLIRKAPIVENGEIAAVIVDDEATLKRVYYYKETNKLVLQAENPRYEPLVYMDEELDSIHILGKAVAVIKKL